MIGHNPFNCKKEIETSSLKNNTFLEIGMAINCDCEKGKCKLEQNNTKSKKEK